MTLQSPPPPVAANGTPGGAGLRLNPFQLVLRRPHGPRTPIKLLGVLRGRGRVLSALGEADVQYEIDAFSAGAVRTATGGLTGDFSRWNGLADLTESAVPPAALHLTGGEVLALALVRGEADMLEVDLPCNALLLRLIAEDQGA